MVNTPEDMQPRRWVVMASAISFQDRWLTVRSDKCVTPAGTVIAPWHVLDYPDWVNVVALNDQGQMVLVRQYRHGIGEVLLGLPSGACEQSDGSDPVKRRHNAAARELSEETGYRASSLVPVLCSYPNAANHSNAVTSFLATGIELSGVAGNDPFEPVEIVLEDIATVLTNLRTGKWRWQSMHVAALWSAVGRVLCHSTTSGITPEVRQRIATALGEAA